MNDRLKRIKEYKTELVFANSGKEEIKEMQFRTPSMAAQDDYISIRQQHQQELSAITTDDNYKDFKDLRIVEPANFAGDPEKLAKSFEMSGRIVKCHSKFTIIYYKAAVDTRQLTTTQQEQFNSEVDSDFWQNQDLVMMEDAVEFFRGHLKV